MKVQHVLHFENSTWGHALHSSTWRPVPARWHGRRLIDWLTGTRRYTLMVHSRTVPEAGFLMVYKTEDGPATARIEAVKWWHDPVDLFTLTVVRTRALDRRYNRLKTDQPPSGAP